MCPELEVASLYSKKFNVDAVTLDGDRADRKGAISGGFIDSKHSRLEAAKNVKKWQVRIDDENLRLRKLKKEIAKTDQEITAARDSLLTLEERRKSSITGRDPLSRKLNEAQDELSHLSSIISNKVENKFLPLGKIY